MDAYLKNQFDFTGVKAALLVEQSILVILRDNKPDIPWPNTWELPGGGREGQETPLECLQREVHFGDEGQEFKLMPVEDFIKAEGVIPQLQERFKDYLSEKEENNIWTNGKN